MDMGSDVGTPLTGTQISIWPLPEKAKGHSPRALYPTPEARPLLFCALRGCRAGCLLI